MKTGLTTVMAVIALLCLVGMASANLVTIGTAAYDVNNNGTIESNEHFKLIYDNDDTGHSGGGLVWLDYSHGPGSWGDRNAWAVGIGSALTVTLNPGYTTSIDWSTGWRLPDTVDGADVYGYEGDPDNDGIYTYTSGYNLANSEMGHLFYTELGNQGRFDTSGNDLLGGAIGLQNTGDFDHLVAHIYWSGTQYTAQGGYVWYFTMGNVNNHAGYQDRCRGAHDYYGLAVHEGTVSAVPIPGALWLLGSGLFGLVAVRRREERTMSL
jgi:hypothetical protein